MTNALYPPITEMTTTAAMMSVHENELCLYVSEKKHRLHVHENEFLLYDSEKKSFRCVPKNLCGISNETLYFAYWNNIPGTAIEVFRFEDQPDLSSIKSKDLVSLNGNLLSVDYVEESSFRCHQINLKDVESIKSIEDSRYMELFSVINSQEWTPLSLRDALLEQFPDICSILTMGVARTIDSLAFHNVKGFNYTGGFYWNTAYSFYWNKAYGFPLKGLWIDGSFVSWCGAFTFQLEERYTVIKSVPTVPAISTISAISAAPDVPDVPPLSELFPFGAQPHCPICRWQDHYTDMIGYNSLCFCDELIANGNCPVCVYGPDYCDCDPPDDDAAPNDDSDHYDPYDPKNLTPRTRKRYEEM